MRSIKPDEQAQSLWDEVQNPENTFITTDLKNNKVWSVQEDISMETRPYMFYNKADEAEDAVLFADELISPTHVIPFKEVSNPITRLEIGAGTLTKYLAQVAKNMDFEDKVGPKTPKGRGYDDESSEASDSIYDTDEEDREFDDKYVADEAGTVTKHWRLPQIWEEALKRIDQGSVTTEEKQLLERVGLFDASNGKIRKSLSDAEFARNLKRMDRLMLMEKDRGDGKL